VSAEEHQCWWRDEFESIREGADPTPGENGTQLTPERLWFRLLMSHREERTRMLLSMQASAVIANTCQMQDHEGMAEVMGQMAEALAAKDRENRALMSALIALGEEPVDVSEME
jgi:hypothetical protein